MAFTKVRDVDLEILSYIETDFDLVVSLSVLDKSSYRFMKTTNIYQELIIFRKNVRFEKKNPMKISEIKRFILLPNETINHILNFNWFDNETIIIKCCKWNLFKLFQIKLMVHLTHEMLNNRINIAIIYAAKYNRIRFFKFLKNIIFNNNISLITMIPEQIGVFESIKIFETVKIFENAMLFASFHGHLQILQWLEKNKLFRNTLEQLLYFNPNKYTFFSFFHNYVEKHYDEFPYNYSYSKKLVVSAAFNGHTHVLEWLKNSKIGLKYSSCAINAASKNGHINVIEWFKNNGYEIIYNNKAIDNACSNGHIHLLEWFKNNKIISDVVINNACGNGHVNIIEWFINNGYNIIYDDKIIHVFMIGNDSAKIQKKIVYYSKIAIDNACMNGHIHVLIWFISSGLKFKYSEFAIHYACKHGHLNILKFFRRNNIPFKRDLYTIDDILKHGQYHISDWFIRKSSSLNYIVPKLKYNSS